MLVTDDDDDDDDGGAVRIYNGGTPYCGWMMEDLQWFDASLWMNEVTRTYNGGMPHSLLGEGEGCHHQLHLPHGPQCGTAFISLW